MLVGFEHRSCRPQQVAHQVLAKTLSVNLCSALTWVQFPPQSWKAISTQRYRYTNTHLRYTSLNAFLSNLLCLRYKGLCRSRCMLTVWFSGEQSGPLYLGDAYGCWDTPALRLQGDPLQVQDDQKYQACLNLFSLTAYSNEISSRQFCFWLHFRILLACDLKTEEDMYLRFRNAIENVNVIIVTWQFSLGWCQ